MLVQRAVKGERRAASQLMSLVENDPKARLRIMSALYWTPGNASVIGITGPPGCGKSSLINQLGKFYRDNGEKVGIVAVDPTSQITGGALLGDRIRMHELATDSRVFIRSMATRGYSGGVARATEDIVRILDALRMQKIMVETTGAGQSDIDVRKIAQTTIVVAAPGLGDEIQALKAGIMEIGDIFVVNKADHVGADKTMREIYSMISMAENASWRPRVLKTNALTGEGIAPLVEAIRQHSEHLKHNAVEEGPEQLTRQVVYATKRYFEDIALEKTVSTQWFKKLLVQIEYQKVDLYTAAQRIFKRTLKTS